MPTPTYSIAELIGASQGFLGVEPYIAAGAFYGVTGPLTVDAAQSRLAGWLATVVTVPPGPGPAPVPQYAELLSHKDQPSGYPGLDASGLLAPAVTGSLPVANGTDDTSAINNAIAVLTALGGGVIRGVRGNAYKTSAPIVVGSGVTLEMWGCSSTLLAGSDCNMVNNKAMTAVASAADAAVTSGSNVVTTSLASQAVVGQTLVVAGAGAAGNGPLTGNVSAVNTGGGTITLTKLDGSTNATATATVATAAVSLFNRDKNVRVVGGIWNRGANNGTGSGRHSLRFFHVDGLTVDVQGYTASNGKESINIGDATDLWVRAHGINCSSTGAGTVQLIGPIYGGHVESVIGHTMDDLCAITCNDWPTYNTTCGDVYHVTFGTLVAEHANAHVLRLIAGAGCAIDGVKANAILGTTNSNGVWIGDDYTFANTIGGTYGSIDLGYVNVIVGSGASNAHIVLSSPSATRIKAHVVASDTQNRTCVISVSGQSTTTIGTLEVSGDFLSGLGAGRGVYVAPTSGTLTVNEIICDKWQVTASPLGLVEVAANSVVNHVTVRDPSVNITVAGTIIVHYVAGSLNRVSVIGGRCAGTAGGTVFKRETATTAMDPVIHLVGTVVNGFGRCADVRAGTTTFVLDNPRFEALTAAAFFTNAGILNFAGAITTSGSFTMLQRAAAETVQANGSTLRFDASVLTPSDGDLVYNTNAAYGTGPLGLGVVVYNAVAAKWKNLYTGLTN